MTDVKVVYIVFGGGGIESVWSLPMPAIEAREKFGPSAYVAVRPVDHTVPTEAAERALAELRGMERDRHNTKAEKIRERNLRR